MPYYIGQQWQFIPLPCDKRKSERIPTWLKQKNKKKKLEQHTLKDILMAVFV